LRQAVAEADDPEERQRAVDEILQISGQLAQYGGQQYIEQLQKWEAWKANEIKSRGLDPAEPRFARQYSSGQQGLAEFMADLTTAENEKLKKELSQAKKASDPATIAALVRKEMAKVAAEAGYDTVDLAEPEQPAANQNDAWERDAALLQAGRMSPATYLKKWGGR
jgi:hypothetical protein